MLNTTQNKLADKGIQIIAEKFGVETERAIFLVSKRFDYFFKGLHNLEIIANKEIIFAVAKHLSKHHAKVAYEWHGDKSCLTLKKFFKTEK